MGLFGGWTAKALVLAALLVTSACGDTAPPVAGLPPGSAGGEQQVAAVGGDEPVELKPQAYTLASGDRVRVNVFRHEDLSGEFQLDGNGNFAMPLVGEVNADGLTTRELEENIELAYQDGFLVNPQVSVEVLSYRPFFILGEVNSPGSYEYQNGMTILNAAALAGGFTYRAANDQVRLQRGGSNARPIVVTPTTQILPGDIITVPERWF